MVAVAVRVLRVRQVLLVVVLGVEVRAERADLGGDLAVADTVLELLLGVGFQRRQCIALVRAMQLHRLPGRDLDRTC